MTHSNDLLLEDAWVDPLDQLDELVTPPPDPDEMLGLLLDPDATKRMVAARAFCEISDERAIEPLLTLLADSCPLVRVSAAYALGRNSSPTIVDQLIHTLQTDWNGYVRKGLVWALGNCGDRRALMPLIHALKTDISAVRLWSASSLPNIAKLAYEDVIATVPPLIEALRRDAMPAVRSNCAWAVGQMCRELPSNVIYATAVDALLEALVEDSDLGVKEDARASLLKLGDPRGLQMIEELELDGLI